MEKILGWIAKYVRKNAIEGARAASVRNLFEGPVPENLVYYEKKNEKKK